MPVFSNHSDDSQTGTRSVGLTQTTDILSRLSHTSSTDSSTESSEFTLVGGSVISCLETPPDPSDYDSPRLCISRLSNYSSICLSPTISTASSEKSSKASDGGSARSQSRQERAMPSNNASERISISRCTNYSSDSFASATLSRSYASSSSSRKARPSCSAFSIQTDISSFSRSSDELEVIRREAVNASRGLTVIRSKAAKGKRHIR